MGPQDLLITPIYLIITYAVAYALRPYVTNSLTKKYFIPALTLKIVGAIALGVIFEFYYGYGGDTFHFFNNGMSVIADAFYENPIAGITLIFGKNELKPITSDYIHRIPMFYDTATYFVIRIGGLFTIFTYKTYSATAVLFAVFSFSGLWAMYQRLVAAVPDLYKHFAIATFFFPSVFFWGSGILKDPITFGALAWLTYAILDLVIFKKRLLSNLLIILFFGYIIYVVKIYIILCFIPAGIIWIFLQHSQRLKNKWLRMSLTPTVLILSVLIGMYASIKIGESHNRYSLDRVFITAEETAKWLTIMGKHDEGSVYSLGDFDYSPAGVARKAIPAVWVSLFRPYVWESKNPVMLLSALESSVYLLLTLILIFKHRMNFFNVIRKQPFIAFCLLFSIMFAFAIGISTYNFGSLVRYKIPIMPFYLYGLFCIDYIIASKSSKKLIFS